MKFAYRIALVLVWLAGCNPSNDRPETAGIQVRMDFQRAAFFDAPFPSDDLQNPDGSIRIEGYPNPDKIPFMETTLEVIRDDVKGFGLASAVFFQLTDEPDYIKLPDVRHRTKSRVSPKRDDRFPGLPTGLPGGCELYDRRRALWRGQHALGSPATGHTPTTQDDVCRRGSSFPRRRKREAPGSLEHHAGPRRKRLTGM